MLRFSKQLGAQLNRSAKPFVSVSHLRKNITSGVSQPFSLTLFSLSVSLPCVICFISPGPLRADAAGVTSGGALQCDFILHMLGPHSVADTTLRVTKVLKCCEDKQITTVSFPAVGTGRQWFISGSVLLKVIINSCYCRLPTCRHFNLLSYPQLLSYFSATANAVIHFF